MLFLVVVVKVCMRLCVVLIYFWFFLLDRNDWLYVLIMSLEMILMM